MNTINKAEVEDIEWLMKQLIDRNISDINICIRTRYDEMIKEYEHCSGQCTDRCETERLKVNVRYDKAYPFCLVPGTCEDPIQQETLFVGFQDLEETLIIESPTYDMSTLLSNFGGALGLMTGVSAISILELLVWFLLMLFKRVLLLYDYSFNQVGNLT